MRPQARPDGWRARRRLAAILSIAAAEVLCSPLEKAFALGRPRQVACRATGKEPYREAPGPGAAGQNPFGANQDPADMFKQLFGEMNAGPGGAPGQANMDNPFAAFMGGMGGMGAKEKPKATDAWFTEKFPILQRIKRPVIIAFFAFSFYKGWVGRWGLVFGCMASSYWDMLGVPLRVSERSPFTGKAYMVTQIYAQYFFKITGYFINVAKGKAKFPPDLSKMLMPGGAPGAANGANPFAPGAGGANPFGGLDANNPFDLGMEPEPQYQAPPVQPTDMPTAPTVGPPPPKQAAVLSVEPAEPPAKRPPPRSPPPVVDADVVFLD